MSRVPAPAEKIVSLDLLLERVAARREAGARLVFTNGCFELLHRGHVRYLAAAAELGDLLVVGLNSDRSVRELKGSGRPLVAAEERAEVLAALGAVDFVTIFDQPTAVQLVQALRPEVYVKGGDYAGRPPPEAEVARAVGGDFQLIPFVPGSSTSELARRIRGDGGR